MKLLGCILIVLVGVYLAHSHICILDPPQRSPLSISQPGDNSCFRRTPYCGQIPPQQPAVQYLAGSTATLLFQQNLNHWFGQNPGHFDLWFNPSSNPSSEISTENGWIGPLASFSDYPANDMVTQTNFTFNFQVPESATSHGVLVARYVSLNPFEVYPANNSDSVFYNCVDVQIVTASSNIQTQKKELRPKKLEVAKDSCCTPEQWTATAYEINSVGTVIHEIWYDAVNKMVRWDRSGNIETSANDYLISITNYTVLPGDTVNEFLIMPQLKQCALYGADAFYPWCYGNVSSQSLMDSFEVNGLSMTVWGQDNGFRWVTMTESCAPVSIAHENDQIIFTSFIPAPINPSVWDIPSYCTNGQLIAHHSCKGN